MKSRRGYAITLVLILTLAVAIISASLLNFTLTERRLNHDHLMIMNARGAAEGLIDVGMGQLRERFVRRQAVPIDHLKPGNAPLRIPNSVISSFASTTNPRFSVIMPGANYDANQRPDTYRTELFGGMVYLEPDVFINPTDPANVGDDFIGTTVNNMWVSIYAKATVRDYLNREKSAMAHSILLIRDASLFKHAIFYNMDLEIAPSPAMYLRGKVHANGDIYYMSASGNPLHFMQSFTTAGNIVYGRNPKYANERPNNDAVRFMAGYNASNEPILKSAKIGTRWIEDSMPNFAAETEKAYNFWVMSSAHDMGKHSIVGIEDYKPDNPDTTVANDALNYGYHLIMPASPTKPTTVETIERERQKFAYKAGLTIEIDSLGNVTSVYTYERTSGTTTSSGGSEDSPWDTTVVGAGAAGDIVYDASGNPVRVYLNLPDVPITAADTARLRSYNPNHGTRPIVRYVPGAMRDRRENRVMNIVEVDVSRLKKAIEATDIATLSSIPSGKEAIAAEASTLMDSWRPASATPDPKYDPRNWWNGIVYVKTPLQTLSSPRPDEVVPAVRNMGVRLNYGEQLPTPQFARERSIYGFTLATNAPLYVQGNYNANITGNANSDTTNNEYIPDRPWADFYNFARPGDSVMGSVQGDYVEAAAALIGDSVMILSSAFSDATSLNNAQNNAVLTEVAAAIVSGIVPSGKYGGKTYSGGAENFPRFLENWSSRALIYRGSMVCLYESEVATANWGGGYYSPPIRRWGFDNKFAMGYTPPGTPFSRAVTRYDFRWLTPAQWREEIDKLNNSWN